MIPEGELMDEAIEEEQALNRRIMRRRGIKNDLLSFFIVAAMFGAIGLAAELDSVIPLFCIVLASFAYVLRREIKGGGRRGRSGDKPPECFFSWYPEKDQKAFI